MPEFVNRLDLQSIKFNAYVAITMLAVWLTVLGCVISSIRSRPFNSAQRRFWISVVVLVPVGGLLAYLPFSFSREDLPHAFLLKRKKGRKRPASQFKPKGSAN